MRIVIIFTYPVYHGLQPIEEWWRQPDRERFLAAQMVERGCHVEIWAAGDEAETRHVRSPGKNQNKYNVNVRIFKANKKGKKTKYHYSDSMVEYAEQFSAHFYILKGVDGGVGTHFLNRFLRKKKRPFAFILGGKWYSRNVPLADIVFYETSSQKKKLLSPGLFFWRKAVREETLIRLPKWVDTKTFCPIEGVSKKWDILVVSRLIPYYKNFTALGPLSHHFRVAVIGDGPYALRLRSRYPNVEWLGYIPNHELPVYLNQAYLFMHTSFRDYYPRVIAEALSCGLPCAAFADSITPDVLPSDCGLLVSKHDFLQPIMELLNDKNRLERMSQKAREHALSTMGKNAFIKSLDAFFNRLETAANG
jgi:hypothetical protein